MPVNGRVPVENPDYPTWIAHRATANHGDVVEVVYLLNQGTERESQHVAGAVRHALLVG